MEYHSIFIINILPRRNRFFELLAQGRSRMELLCESRRMVSNIKGVDCIECKQPKICYHMDH